MIGVIDYGAGNLASVLNMLRSLGLASVLVESPRDLTGVERLILPGVGHFDHGMRGLQSRGLIDALEQRVLGGGLPLMGICLGAQLLARRSEEGRLPGMGWIDADVVAFDRTRMSSRHRVPHMGWAETWAREESEGEASQQSLWDQFLMPDSRFYFVHSFHLDCDRDEAAILRAHHGYEFAAGAANGNVIGVQFHPEKSHRFGRRVLEVFAAWNPGPGEGA